MKNIVAIITAGGSGKRIKSKLKKQYIEINQRPILFWTLDNFVNHPMIGTIVVSLPQSDFLQIKPLIEKEYPSCNFIFVKGGVERQDSVFNALEVCPKYTEYVLIHDGVRPFITSSEISTLIEYVKTKKAIIPISRVKNTIKEIDENKIVKTISRTNLAAALTPQVFDFDLIYTYHQKAREDKIQATDDASILEYYKQDVFYVECSSQNIKITDQFDLEIAKYILQKGKD